MIIEENPTTSARNTRKRKTHAIQEIEEESGREIMENISATAAGASINLRTRVGPAPFVRLIKGLSEKQKTIVKKIGFGSLLHLSFDKFHGDFVKFLLENLRPISAQLKLTTGEFLDIEEDDVKAVFGLPKGEKDVVEANGKNETEDYTELLKEWRAEWGIEKGSPQTTSMIEKILQDDDDGDKFIRIFVIFTVSCLIRGNQSVNNNFKILLSLVNVGEIKNLNWCKYTRQSLMDAGEEWQAYPPRMFTGPLLFLMICYFDRVQFKGQILDNVFPTIKFWTKDRIDKRVKDERKLGFGLGKVKPRIMHVEEQTEQKGDELLTKEISFISHLHQVLEETEYVTHVV
ncbi:unnamed protein product [Cuscuta europaea]|uniref:Aminotransferase-like plant mobile domain-containing protein n=1 Tax=Cuscuta europaea TaxID=41803 RepID=A0A9P1E5T4_CUSEU|nr:unnamed protein product [Cuscuta europaea]